MVWEKAYDRVTPGILWGVLTEYGVPKQIYQYNQSKSCVRILATKSNLFTSPPPPVAQILQVNEEEVYRVFQYLKTKKAPGPDGVSPSFQLFNKSLELNASNAPPSVRFPRNVPT